MAEQIEHNLTISTSAILIGLTPLIPIPFADDLAKSYFQRRLVRNLASEQKKNLSDEAIKELVDEEKSGCLLGCLTTILIYPFKKILRKVFFFLEIKRSIDIISRTYHYGYLLEYSFKQDFCQPMGSYSATEIREAIQATCREVGTNPIEKAIQATFKQSKQTIKELADMLWKNLSKITGKPNEEDLKQAAETVESAEARKGITSQLQQALESVPADYFQGLNQRLIYHLQNPKKQ